MDAIDPEEFIGWVDKLPDDCKPVASTSKGLSTKQSNSKLNLNTIENVTKLVDLVKNGATNNLKTVNEAIDKANIKGLDRERFLWLTCKDYKKPDKLNVKREEARKKMLRDLKQKKQKMAEELIKIHATQSAITILMEFIAVWSVWELIKSAKSEMESCKKKFDEIERLLAKHKGMADQLKRCIEEYLHSGRPEEREKMRDLTVELTLDLRGTTKMIGNVQDTLKDKITSIGTIAKQKFKFHVSNFVPVFVSASLWYKYWENLTRSYIILLSVITAAFTGLAIANTRNYFSCNQTLDELRSTMEMIEQFDNEIQKIEEIIRRAQELVKSHNLSEETS